MNTLFPTDSFQSERNFDQSLLPPGASIETLQALAHNINFTASRTRQYSNRYVDNGSRGSPRPDFGRGYAMEYFLSLRAHSGAGNRRTKQRVGREMTTESAKRWMDCKEAPITICGQDPDESKILNQDMDYSKRQRLEPESTPHPFGLDEKNTSLELSSNEKRSFLPFAADQKQASLQAPLQAPLQTLLQPLVEEKISLVPLPSDEKLSHLTLPSNETQLQHPFHSDEKKSHLPFPSVEKPDQLPPPAYQEKPIESTYTMSKSSIHRPRSIYRRKSVGYRKEIVKTVTVEVESYENFDANKFSVSGSKSSFVTLIWATSLKSHWQGQHMPRDVVAIPEKPQSQDGPIELPAESRISRDDDSKSVMSLESGWKAPTDWDAKFESLVGNDIRWGAK